MTYVGLLTFIHTLISFVGIALGVLAVRSLFRPALARWRNPFLLAAGFTIATGFVFPFAGPTPAFLTGILATLVLGAVLWAGRVRPATGLRRLALIGGIVASEYLLVFVLVAQAFLKVPALKAMAPTGTEPPFAIAQAVVLVVFIVIGVMALRRAPAEPLPV